MKVFQIKNDKLTEFSETGGKKLNEMNFSSQTSPKLSQERLDKIINELLHEYKYY